MRQKLIRFEENAQLENVLEPGKALFGSTKGRWNKIIFKRKAPLVAEIGCGRGDYTVGLAQEFPGKNFIGIDMKGDRIWFGAKEALENDLQNSAFLRTRIERIQQHIGKNELSEIWITFPGPRPRRREANRRLTNQKFLDIYKCLLKPNGTVHLKTDSDFAYTYTLEQLRLRSDVEIIAKTSDLYASKFVGIHHGIKTHFEKRYIDRGKKIKYISFRFKHSFGSRLIAAFSS